MLLFAQNYGKIRFKEYKNVSMDEIKHIEREKNEKKKTTETTPKTKIVKKKMIPSKISCQGRSIGWMVNHLSDVKKGE